MIFPFNLLENNDAKIAEAKAIADQIVAEQQAALTAKQKANSVIGKSPVNTYQQVINIAVAKINSYFASLFSTMDFELMPKTDPKDLDGNVVSGIYETLNIYRKPTVGTKHLLANLILYKLPDKKLALASFDEDPIEKSLRAIAHGTGAQLAKITPAPTPPTPSAPVAQTPTSTPPTPSSPAPFIRYAGSPNIFDRQTGKYISYADASSLGVYNPNQIEDIPNPRPEVTTGSDFALWDGKNLTTGQYAPVVSTPPPAAIIPQAPLPTPQALSVPTTKEQITADLFNQLGIGLYHLTAAPGYVDHWSATDKGVVHNLDPNTAMFLQSLGVSINERPANIGIAGYNTVGGNTVDIPYILNAFAQLSESQRVAADMARISRLNAFIDQYRGTTTSVDIPADLDPSGKYTIRDGVFMLK